MAQCAIAALLFLFTGLNGAAWGQETGELAPLRFETVDARGVNLAERSFNVSHTISIGDPANGGMSYTAIYDGLWRFYSSVWSSVAHQQMTDPDTMHEYEAWALNYRGRTDVQAFCENVCFSTEGIGGFTVETCPIPNNPGFEYACVKTGYLWDGTRLEFDQTFVTAEIKPNGERLDYHYGPTSSFPISITNNYGYQLRFLNPGPSGAPSAVVLFNMAVDYCDPDALTCPPFTQAWPRLTFERNGGSVGAVTETGGARTAYTYGTTSRLMERIDGPGSRRVDIAYQYIAPNFTNCPSRCGHRVSSVSTGGRTWSYTWDDSLIPPGTDVRVTKVTSAVGSVAYDIFPGWGLSNLPGNPWDFYHISASRIVRIRDELGRATTIENAGHLNPQVTRVTHPEGNGEQYSYYTHGMLSSIRRFAKPGSGAADQVTQIWRGGDITPQCGAYCARPVLVRDARGYVTRNTWDFDSGALLSTETGLQGPNTDLTCAFGPGLCPKITYVNAPMSARYFTAPGQLTAGPPIVRTVSASQCELTTTCAPNEAVVTTFGYGDLGAANNLLVRSETAGKPGQTITTSYSYNANGDLTEINGPRTDVADITRQVWNADRRLVDEIAADNSATHRTYTPEGYLKTMARGTVDGAGQFTPIETITNAFDSAGNLIRVTSPTGVTQYSYDAANRLRCTAVRMNPDVYGTLPTDACALSTQGSNGPDRISQLHYNAAGQLLREVRALGVVAPTFPQTLQQDYATYAYTLNGQRDWVEDALGNRSDFVYDGFDRPCRLFFPVATVGAHQANAPGGTLTCSTATTSAHDYEQYGYDANNNRISLRLRSEEVINYTFDALNRETVRDLPDGTTADVFSAYDLMGRRRYARFGSGGAANSNCTASSNGVDYCYDALGRLLIENAYGRALSYAYADNVNRTRVTWPDGFYVQYTYDAMNRMDQVRENGATSGPGVLADYSYDTIGRRDFLSRGNNTVTDWNFDGASRLLQLVHDLQPAADWDLNLGFGYNPASQVVSRLMSNDAYRWAAPSASRSYVRNGLNQYTSVAGTSFAYDKRGNLTSDGARSFCYDFENHLVGVNGSCASPTVALSYDPLGRLRRIASGGTTTDFVYDGDQLVAEYDDSTLLRRYVHGAGVDEALVFYQRQPDESYAREWLHADHQGSIVASTMETASMPTIYSYGPYGEPDVWAGARFRYTGQIMLPEVALYHYKARAYDPLLGRFLQTDPVGYEDDLNLYQYVRNDPLNNSDPTGKCTAPGALQLCATGFGALIGGGANLGAQLLSGEGSLSERLGSVDWVDVGEAAVAGGLTGLALTTPGLQANPALVGGGISGTVSAARDLVTTGEIDVGDVVGATVGGAIGARGGSEANRVLWGQTNQQLGQAVAAAGGEAAGRTVAERGGPVVREILRPVADTVVRAVDQELNERERQIPHKAPVSDLRYR